MGCRATGGCSATPEVFPGMTEMTESGATATTRPYSRDLDRPTHGPAPANLADILERVLDKGIIIAGDIKVNLLDIELLTIKIRLLIVSVDKADGDGHRLVAQRPDAELLAASRAGRREPRAAPTPRRARAWLREWVR